MKILLYLSENHENKMADRKSRRTPSHSPSLAKKSSIENDNQRQQEGKPYSRETNPNWRNDHYLRRNMTSTSSSPGPSGLTTYIQNINDHDDVVNNPRHNHYLRRKTASPSPSPVHSVPTSNNQDKKDYEVVDNNWDINHCLESETTLSAYSGPSNLSPTYQDEENDEVVVNNWKNNRCLQTASPSSSSSSSSSVHSSPTYTLRDKRESEVIINRKRLSFTCRICRRRFNSEKKMMIHRSVHFELKPFACLYCYKQFSNFNDLQDHTNSHKMFRCAYCGSKFPDRTSFRQHMWMHPL